MVKVNSLAKGDYKKNMHKSLTFMLKFHSMPMKVWEFSWLWDSVIKLIKIKSVMEGNVNSICSCFRGSPIPA